MLPVWIEHTTSPLPRECSTTELRQQKPVIPNRFFASAHIHAGEHGGTHPQARTDRHPRTAGMRHAGTAMPRPSKPPGPHWQVSPTQGRRAGRLGVVRAGDEDVDRASKDFELLSWQRCRVLGGGVRGRGAAPWRRRKRGTRNLTSETGAIESTPDRGGKTTGGMSARRASKQRCSFDSVPRQVKDFRPRTGPDRTGAASMHTAGRERARPR